MYGKIFESMFEGSMVGAGPTVFAVWSYCIAKADPEDHMVTLNPMMLATIIGTTIPDIQGAIKYLVAPDASSRCPDHGGRRLLHMSGFAYFVVSHQHYRDILSKKQKRDKDREYSRKRRVLEKKSQNVGKSSASVYVSGIDRLSPKRGSVRGGGDKEQFERCWAAFGRYGVKKKSLEYWRQYRLQEDRDAIEAAISGYLDCVAHGRTKSQFEGWINPRNRKWDMDWGKCLEDLKQKAAARGSHYDAGAYKSRVLDR